MIVGWYNPYDKNFYGLDDLEMGRVMPRGILNKMVRKEREDTRHSLNSMTVTSGITCPRQLCIERMLEVKPDPLKRSKMLKGTYLHEQFGLDAPNELDEDGNEIWYSEEKNPDECEVKGKLFGIETSGLIDMRRKDWSVILDWKTGNSYGLQYNGVCKIDHAIQMNALRILAEQNFNIDLSEVEMKVWYTEDWKPTYANYMTEEDIGKVNVCVGNEKYTKTFYNYKELFTTVHKMFMLWCEKAVKYDNDLTKVPYNEREDICRGIHKYGLDMFVNASGGNMCKNYCSVKLDCDKLDR